MGLHVDRVELDPARRKQLLRLGAGRSARTVEVPGPAHASPPLEGRLLLRGERRHAAREVLGVAARGDRLRLELHLRLEALPRGLVEEALGAAEGLRRSLRELARERLDAPLELRAPPPTRHHPPPHRLPR